MRKDTTKSFIFYKKAKQEYTRYNETGKSYLIILVIIYILIFCIELLLRAIAGFFGIIYSELKEWNRREELKAIERKKRQQMMRDIRDAHMAAAEGASYGWQKGKAKAQQQIKQQRQRNTKPIMESELEETNEVISQMYGKKGKWL